MLKINKLSNILVSKINESKYEIIEFNIDDSNNNSKKFIKKSKKLKSQKLFKSKKLFKNRNLFKNNFIKRSSFLISNIKTDFNYL